MLGLHRPIFVLCNQPSTRHHQLRLKPQPVDGDTNPRGPGFIERPLAAPIEDNYAGRHQTVHSGSYGVIPFSPAMTTASFTLQCWIWPTIPATDPSYWKHGEQTILSRYGASKGFALFLDAAGRLAFRINDEVLTAPNVLRDHAWHFVAASFDAKTGEAKLYHEPELSYALDPSPIALSTPIAGLPEPESLPLMIAAHAAADGKGLISDARFPEAVRGTAFFNGKIEQPTLSNRALSRFEIERMKQGAASAASERRFNGPTGALASSLVGCWNFSRGIDTMSDGASAGRTK